VAPPKRRTGGRVTPKGTKPGQLPRAGAPPVGGGSSSSSAAAAGVSQSSRYTPPVPRELQESPKWVPILMVAFLVIGAIFILARYLFADEVGNWPVFAGLACVLAGLYTATKWH
jgi:hypothetical protein